MRVAVYSRVSTDAQERDGTSLGTQELACVEHAERLGWHIVETIRDSASGFTLDRPGVQHLRDLVRRQEVQVVLAYAVDRLSRNQNHIGVLFDEAQGFGVRLEFVTEDFQDTAVGRFILAARAFAAEVEREKITERTSRGKTQRALSGRLPQATGKGIYGYQYDRLTGKRQLDQSQAQVVMRVFEEFVSGSGVSRIASGLNVDDIPALGGGRWHPLTVRRLLMNETYTGKTIYRRTRVEFSKSPLTGKRTRKVVARDEAEWIEVPNVSPSIVQPELFARAQVVLADPNRRQRGQPTGVYRLRGRLRCSACGTRMTGQALGEGRWRYYRCRNSYSSPPDGKCNERYIPRDLLESAVFNELIAIMTDEERLRDELCRRSSDVGQDARQRQLGKELERVEDQRKRLARLFVSGDFPEDVLQAEATRLSAEHRRLQQQLRAIGRAEGSRGSAEELLSRLPEVARMVASWVRIAEGENLDLLLRALDVQVTANREQAVVSASVPSRVSRQDQDLVTIERTWA